MGGCGYNNTPALLSQYVCIVGHGGRTKTHQNIHLSTQCTHVLQQRGETFTLTIHTPMQTDASKSKETLKTDRNTVIFWFSTIHYALQ